MDGRCAQVQPMLVIMNPRSGMKLGAKNLCDILSILQSGGYLPTVLLTEKSGDAARFVRDYGKDAAMIVCIGGDGTLNEVVTGMVEAGLTQPIGYLPAGSTNDFAGSLGLSRDLLTAARDVVSGRAAAYDVGSFDGRCFTYVASFGAFTRSSYSTPQDIKNALGHVAYILSGIYDLARIVAFPMRVETDTQVFEGEYIFGAISNSTSIGGMLHYDPEIVDLNDGLLEVLLIRVPANPAELAQLLYALSAQAFDESDCIQFVSTTRVKVETRAEVDWSLDGEYEKGRRQVCIRNLRDAIRVIVPNRENA